MKWSVGVTTALRPKSTLEKTLASLRSAGWNKYRIFDDKTLSGVMPNWLCAVRNLLSDGPDAIFICQDDVLFCNDLRQYLEKTIWPADNALICSPYTPHCHQTNSTGWHEVAAGWHLVGALAWAMPARLAQAVLDGLEQIKETRHIDAHVGKWAKENGKSVWYHTPSLAQHIGLGNSALGDNSLAVNRYATDFVGASGLP